MLLSSMTVVLVMLVPFVDGPPILSHVGATVNASVPVATVPPFRHRLVAVPL
jgi:hypothetical protein